MDIPRLVNTHTTCSGAEPASVARYMPHTVPGMPGTAAASAKPYFSTSSTLLPASAATGAAATPAAPTSW